MKTKELPYVKNTLSWSIEGPYEWRQLCCGTHANKKWIKQNESYDHPLIMGSYCWECKEKINNHFRRETNEI